MSLTLAAHFLCAPLLSPTQSSDRSDLSSDDDEPTTTEAEEEPQVGRPVVTVSVLPNSSLGCMACANPAMVRKESTVNLHTRTF